MQRVPLAGMRSISVVVIIRAYRDHKRISSCFCSIPNRTKTKMAPSSSSCCCYYYSSNNYCYSFNQASYLLVPSFPTPIRYFLLPPPAPAAASCSFPSSRGVLSRYLHLGRSRGGDPTSGSSSVIRRAQCRLPGASGSDEPRTSSRRAAEEDNSDDETLTSAAVFDNDDAGRRPSPEELEEHLPKGGAAAAIEESVSTKDFIIIAACAVGLLTGLGVVLFNTAVHEIRDFFWDGLPSRGASLLREEPIEETWQRVILVPVCGGVIVGMLNTLRSSLKSSADGTATSLKDALRPLLKAIAASVTLGTGNSLGPEGPSVEIGSSIAKGIVRTFGWQGGKSLSLIAAGSAAGISSGFNASVAGCFFAVESVLWPSPSDSFSSLSSSTSMVILSSVIASVISEVGLGSDPAFIVPEYDFRSPSELPLYLLLGVLCGMVSITLSGCTSLAMKFVNYLQKTTGLSKTIFPAMGGLTVGLMAMSYPEVLYWGFQNVDILLESRPFVDGLPASILFELVGVKILATSLSRASGLVGGYYAPSLFIGAATGMAYGKFVTSALSGPHPWFHISLVEVASPQAYGLVGMAATLAGVCQVPLTAVLLLFELTQDYRIVLPLLGAVGLSSWISSNQNIRRNSIDKWDEVKMRDREDPQSTDEYPVKEKINDSTVSSEEDTIDLCELETSLCLYDTSVEISNLADRLTVSQAMRAGYPTISMNTSVEEVVNLMLVEKQAYAVITNEKNCLEGILVLEDINKYSKLIRERSNEAEVDKILVSHVCDLKGDNCKAWIATPGMTLLAAERIMDSYGIDQLPVILDDMDGEDGRRIVGLLDRDCISIVCRAEAMKQYLGAISTSRRAES